jgi:hypothetical protein
MRQFSDGGMRWVPTTGIWIPNFFVWVWKQLDHCFSPFCWTIGWIFYRHYPTGTVAQNGSFLPQFHSIRPTLVYQLYVHCNDADDADYGGVDDADWSV